MRWVLFIFALLNGAATLLFLLSSITKAGTDIQLIGAGVFMTAFVLAVGLIGVLSRLEQIRDRRS